VKAEKLGVKVERRNDLESMREFVKLNYITRKKHGLPPQPDNFFWNMHEMMISKNLGFVNIARLNDIPIAGAVFFVFKKTIYFKFGASNESFLSYRPNHIVMSEAIKWGCESGFKFFDFGRTDIADDGLLNYKRQWGTDEDNLLYYRIDRNLKIRWDLNKSSFMKLRPLIRKVPVPFLRMLGKLFYRHFG
jgi:lipid II:glycine glycyltransferase (peptidoglycan interpeptide bridge formation enzyme)